MKKNKYAAYVLGDENIGIGVLASLSSFKHHNDDFDLYFYTYVDKLDAVIKEELEELGTYLCDISAYAHEADVFGSFKSGQLSWPKEIYLSYYVPKLLVNDYEYIVKLDHDLLTLDTLEMDSILPKNHMVLSSIYNPFNLYEMSLQDVDYYSEKYHISVETMKKIGVNMGFLVINTKQFVDRKIFENMQILYMEILEDNEEIVKRIYSDQGLLTMYLGFESIPFRTIPNKYNLTVTLLKTEESQEYVNIHFTGKIKPWNPIEMDPRFLRDYGISIYSFIPVWRDFMLEHHPKAYKTLSLNDVHSLPETAVTFNALYFKREASYKNVIAAHQAREIEYKKIEKDYHDIKEAHRKKISENAYLSGRLSSTKYLIKRLIYLNLTRFTKKNGGNK